MRRKLITTLCALAVLSGCQKESGTAPAAAKKAHERADMSGKQGPTQEEMTAGMVEAVTQGKSQAPVSMKFDLPSRPVEGQPVEVAIALLPQIAADKATVNVTGSEGLQLASEDNQFEFPAVDPAQVYRHNVKVTAAAEGVYLLTLNVTLKHDPLDDIRVFSVPIIVATALDAPAAGAAAGGTQPGAAQPGGKAAGGTPPSSARAGTQAQPRAQ
jgi:hypothetical protein